MKGKTKIALGTLMTCLIIGNVGFAEVQKSGSIYQSTTISDSIIIDYDKVLTFGTGAQATKETFGIFSAADVNIELTGDEITVNSNTGNYDGSRTIYVQGGSLNLGNEESIININTSGKNAMSITSMGLGSNIEINAKTLNVNVTEGGVYGIHVQNNTEEVVAPENAASIDINADNIVINGTDLGISAFSNGQIDVNGNLVINADHVIDTRGNATININTDGKHTTVLNGDIVFETPNSPGDAQNSGKIINSYVNVNLSGEDSSWTGRAYQQYKIDGEAVDKVELEAPEYHGNVTGFEMHINAGAQWNMTGDSFINDIELSDGGVINMQNGATEFNASLINLNDGVINLDGENQNVSVNELKGTNGTVNVANESNKLAISENNAIDSLTVSATGNYAEQLAQNNVNESLQKLADQVVDNTATGAGKSAATDLYVAETAVAGAITAEVGEDGNLLANTVNEKVNTSNDAISNMANIALMAWRAENNDMNKRLGELRDSKGEHGIWARMVRGEGTYESIKNQYNTYQLGYDEKLSTNPNWTLGAALSYTEGESSFNGGSGENKHTGFAVYGSYLNDDGSFIDLIAKYARLDHDFDVNGGAGSGDYDTNGYSVSAEYGKRFTQDNGMWIEPQVELTYGKIGSANYTTDNGVSVRQDGMDSLVGRVGFALGKDFKQGNAYVRASYLYDFDGETDMTFSKNGVTRGFEQDLGGGWWEVGVGTNINLSDATHLYMDVEKTYGGDVATPWQWNVGVRYSF